MLWKSWCWCRFLSRQFRCVALRRCRAHCSNMTLMLILRFYEHVKKSDVAIYGFCENHNVDGLNMAANSWGHEIQIFRIEGIQAALLNHDFEVDSHILWTCEKIWCCNFWNCENHNFEVLNMAVSSWGQAIQIFRIEGMQAALLKHDCDVDPQILWTCKKNLMLQFLDFAKNIILMVWTWLSVPEAT